MLLLKPWVRAQNWPTLKQFFEAGLIGGELQPSAAAEAGPPVRWHNISPTDRENKDSPYYNAFRKEAVEEAVERATGRWNGDPESCPQIGDFLKVALPSMDEKAAKMRARGAVEIEKGCIKDTTTGARTQGF